MMVVRCIDIALRLLFMPEIDVLLLLFFVLYLVWHARCIMQRYPVERELLCNDIP
jgi:hypothetical protein